MTEEIGRTYAGRYRIEGELGRGGMAVVYLAFDSRMKRRVALKVLYPHLALRDEHKIRFQREAEVVANLNHRNIVRIYDYSGSESEDNFIVAEYVEGPTLKRFAAENPLVLPEIGAMMAHEIAGALEHAHRNHVIHRDVKPENVMFDCDGVLKLMDFGIAQIKDVQQMTVTGQMIGSPAHMSPEHIEGRNLDHRSDIFSLGTVLYLLCVGELPFKGATAHALFKRILDVNYVPAVQANPAVGEELSAVIDRCLRKERDERYQSCAELQLALASHLRAFGFDNSGRELADFFASPKQYQENGRARVIDRLLEKARGLVAEKRLGQAMRCFDRALCLDETRVDIVQELERLRQRVELARTFIRLVLPALAVTALVGGVGWFWMSGNLDALLGGGPPPENAARLLAAGANNGSGETDVVSSGRQPGEGTADTSSPRAADARGDLSSEHDGTAEPGGNRGSAPARGLDAAGQRDVAQDAAGAVSGSSPGTDIRQTSDLVRLSLLETEARRMVTGARSGWKRVEAERLKRLQSARLGSDHGLSNAVRDAAERVGTVEDRGKPGTPDKEDGRPHGKKNIGDRTTEITGAGAGEKTDVGAKAAEAVLVPVIIEAYPAPTEIWVDDVQRGMRKVDGLRLPPGPHVLRLHHPTCDACEDTVREFRIEAGQQLVSLKEKIGLKPAEVVVRSSAPGQVFVDAELAGRTNDVLRVKARDHLPWKVALKVLFDDQSLSPYEHACMVVAGRRADVAVPTQ